MPVRHSQRNKSFIEGLKVWKFALFSAFAMTIPYLLVALFLGPEFPSLFGGLIGVCFVLLIILLSEL